MDDRDTLANLIDPNALELDTYPWPRDAADRVLASDWLAGVKSAAWDEGARWAFEEITGEPERRFGLAPGDNPYRKAAE